MTEDVAAVVLAAGQGRRMGGTNKALLPLGDEPVLAHSMRAFRQAPSVGEITLVMSEEHVQQLADRWDCTPSDLGATSAGNGRWVGSPPSSVTRSSP